MKNSHVLCLCAALAAGGQASPPATAPAPSAVPALKATVLDITSSLALDENDMRRWFPQSAGVPQARGSISLTLLLQSDAPLLNLRNEVAISQAEDEQHRPLPGPVQARFTRLDHASSSQPQIGKDGKSVLLAITIPGQPLPGTHSVHIHGSLTAATPGKSHAVALRNVPLRIGEELHADDATFRIVRLEPSSSGGLQVTFRSSSALLHDMQFRLPGGKALQSTRDPNHREQDFQRRGLEQNQAQFIYAVDPGMPETVDVQITLDQARKAVEIPFDATVSLGL
jgi:hypothetical protein